MTMYQVRNVAAFAASYARKGFSYDEVMAGVAVWFGEDLGVRILASHAYQVATSRMGR